MSARPLVGQPLDRTDGPLKVRGAAKFAAEFALPRLVHAVLVQSTVAAATIASIDSAAAEVAPGVLAVMTPANAPKLAGGKVDPPASRALSLLQDDAVHYDGQPVAVVVAETLEQARAAARLLDVRYRPATAIVDFTAAKSRAFAPKTANQHPTDVDWGDYDAGLAAGAVQVDAVYTTPVENHNPMEPHATIAAWNGDHLTLYDSTQGVFGARKTVAAHFGIALEQVRVLSPFVGGGFGCKGSVWSHVVLAAMAAKQVGRPVKLVLDRPQMFAPIGHRPNTEQHIVLAATREGRLTALRHDVISTTSMIEDWVEPSAAASRMLYDCANGRTSHRLVRLNVGTPTFQRAPGEATGTTALEIAMDELAYQLGMDPLALRLLNYADAEPVEHKPFSEKALRQCYHDGAERFGWVRRSPEPRSMRDGRWLIGWGMATATYPALRSKAAAHARIQADGSALVTAGTQDIGTGTYTIMTQVAADELGLPVHKLRFELGDTDMPATPVSGGSQTAASVAPAVQAACRAARERLIALALADAESPLHGVASEDIVATDGWLAERANPARRDAFAAIIARHGGTPIEGHAETPGAAEAKKDYALHSFGAVFVEVGVDPDLGLIRLRRMHGTYDVGRVLNAKTATSQLMGGLVWGAGLALFEETLMDPHSGRIANANLAEYHVPVNADIGEIDVKFVGEPDTRLNPLGARGIGEIGITGVAGAIVNAVYHATGKRVRDLPVTLDKLL